VTIRRILHVDMDAFFASVELLRHPELAGLPVVVGGAGDRGVVAAASYAARVYGVRSAMATIRARRLCPELVVVAPDHAHYSAVSSRIMDCCREFAPLVEPLSLDEAFLDITGAQRLLGPDESIATALRQRLWDREGLWSSVGVASTKLVAKLASEAAKPVPGLSGGSSGVCVVDPADELEFLWDRPVSDLWGVGPVTGDRLRALGVSTVADLARFPRAALESHLGAGLGRQLHDLANGRDDRPVVADAEVRSISHEETFGSDLTVIGDLRAELVVMAEKVGRRARRRGLVGRTVHLKVRWSDLVTTTRSRTLAVGTDDGLVVARVATELLGSLPVERGVRLIGVGLSSLGPAGGSSQLELSLSGVGTPAGDLPNGRGAALRAADEVRERFGEEAIAPLRRRTGDPSQGGT